MRKIAVVFPGQGTQYVGMGKTLASEYEIAARVFEEADDALGFGISKLIFEGDMNGLTDASNAQPAVIAASRALYSVCIQEFGIQPDLVAGHSLGEISALIAGGGLPFGDGIRLARKRGSIMHKAFLEKRGKAALVMGVDEAAIARIVDEISESVGYVTISGYNSPIQTLISGEARAVHELGNRIRHISGDFIPFGMLPMKVDAPYHSALMSSSVAEVQAAFSFCRIAPLHRTVLSSVSALPYKTHEEIGKMLSVQLVKPVKWKQVMSYITENGISIVLDIGPQYVLKTLTEENTRHVISLSFDVHSDRERLSRILTES
jgi:[acyl-carrier-protein] S-malonyltransferase